MDSWNRFWIDIERDGGPMLIITMLLVRLLPPSWLRIRGMRHRYDYNPVHGYGYVALAVEMHTWMPLLGWRLLSVRQDPQWQHLSLFSVSSAASGEERLLEITRALDDALQRSGTTVDFLQWQAWPCYSSNAFVWPPHHDAITAQLGECVWWYSSFTCHVAV